MPLWFVALLVLILVPCSWMALDTERPSQGGPWLLGDVLHLTLVFGAACALQVWLPHVRTAGFILLLWIPCLFVTVVVFVLTIGAPVTGGVPSNSTVNPFLVLMVSLAVIEAAAIAIWVLPWLGALFSGRPASSRTSGGI